MALRADDVDIDRDRDLVRRFQAGDSAAFDELFRRYYQRLERFCFRRTSDKHAAEEITQEAFTRALCNLDDLDGERRFYPWVSVIAARLCVDYFRRQSRSEPYPDPNPGGATGGEVEDIVDAVDASLAVVALGRLAPRHQDVLHLREVEDWSYQRIAEHYGVTVGTVETLLFRARRALRREFRLVDGAGLAAIPLLGRVLSAAGRFRPRIPSWLPTPPSPTALAVAATATAATVALAVGPYVAPTQPSAPPQAHYQTAGPKPIGPVTTGRTHGTPSAGNGVVASATPPFPALVTATSVPTVSPTSLAPVAPLTSGPSLPQPAEATTTTTTLPPAAPAGAGSGLIDPTLLGGGNLTTLTTLPPLPSLRPLAGLLPPVALPPLTLPPVTLDVGGVKVTVPPTRSGPAGQLLEGALGPH